MSKEMGREIKFRAWDHDIMVHMPLCTNFGLSRFFGYLSEDAIIMQFTGLYDKDGKEIYEGGILSDIVINGDVFDDAVVVFDAGAFCLSLLPNYIPCLYKVWAERISVIGNIYENSDLIEEDVK